MRILLEEAVGIVSEVRQEKKLKTDDKALTKHQQIFHRLSGCVDINGHYSSNASLCQHDRFLHAAIGPRVGDLEW